jgi:NADH-quinone oxidoreductase subunit L
MAGEQNLDKMGGFRKAMPFTLAMMAIGGLALAGVPPFSGFFSKDEILTYVAAREDWHVVLAIVGYIGAFLTAVYTWRMIFRAFFNEPVEPARELEQGHLYHAPEHRNPATGEVEDTDVGFPGPDHHIAEREWSMKAAMALLAVGAIFAGLLQVPQVTHVIDTFLHPTFEDSTYFESLHPSDGLTWGGLALGALLALGGIALAYSLFVKDAERRRVTALRERLSGLHRLFARKWYFDEIIDTIIVRPFAMFGRFARDVFERVFVNGVLIGGPSGAVRAGSAAVRAVQSGFLRYYAALLLVGVTALGLYFLISAS